MNDKHETRDTRDLHNMTQGLADRTIKPALGVVTKTAQDLLKVAAIVNADMAQTQVNPAAALTAERGKTHGNFDDNATVSQRIKDVIRTYVNSGETTPAWDKFTPAMKDSLDTIAAKIGRIVAGQPDFKDHWDDIAGYAHLISNRCMD